MNECNFVFDLSGLNAELDRDGNLSVILPIQGGPIFTPEATDGLTKTLGRKKAEQTLDDAAELIHKTAAAHIFASRLR